MFDETTPVKACSDFNYHFSDIGGMVFMNFFNCSSFLFFFSVKLYLMLKFLFGKFLLRKHDQGIRRMSRVFTVEKTAHASVQF